MSTEIEPISPRDAAKVDDHLACLTPRMKAFVELMVWKGLKHIEAGKQIGVSEVSVYAWLRNPKVRNALDVEMKVLKSSARAGNIHALVEVRDNAENQMARVQAVKVIEDLASSGTEHGANAGKMAGYVVIIGGQPQMANLPQETAKPLIEHEPVRQQREYKPIKRQLTPPDPAAAAAQREARLARRDADNAARIERKLKASAAPPPPQAPDWQREEG